MVRYIRRSGLRVVFVLGGLVQAAILALLFGLLVMLLWNWVMPDIFGLGTLGYWQAWGLVLMAHILFKAASGQRGVVGPRHDPRWREKMRQKLEQKHVEHNHGPGQKA
jgi:hypothetical protein